MSYLYSLVLVNASSSKPNQTENCVIPILWYCPNALNYIASMLKKLLYQPSNSNDVSASKVSIRISSSQISNNLLQLPTERSSSTLLAISSPSWTSLSALKSGKWDCPNLSFTKWSKWAWYSRIVNSIYSGEGSLGRLPAFFLGLCAIPTKIG